MCHSVVFVCVCVCVPSPGPSPPWLPTCPLIQVLVLLGIPLGPPKHASVAAVAHEYTEAIPMNQDAAYSREVPSVIELGFARRRNVRVIFVKNKVDYMYSSTWI